MTTTNSRELNSSIRAWARAHGYTVAERGRLPNEIMQKWRDAGSPVPAKLDLSPDDPRLPERIRAKIALDPETGCWEWLGARDSNGYGRIGWHGATQRAHRIVYTMLVGDIPNGLVLDHFQCDRPRCVNPSHLRPTTQRENVLRGVGPSARYARATECLHGHPYTGPESDVRIDSNGRRRCRTCQRAYRAAHRDEISARQRAYRAEHGDEVRAYFRAYRATHRDEITAHQRTYQAAHREDILARQRARRAAAKRQRQESSLGEAA